eukprot:5670112-Pyramimonas_sp.AAC.1
MCGAEDARSGRCGAAAFPGNEEHHSRAPIGHTFCAVRHQLVMDRLTVAHPALSERLWIDDLSQTA